MIDLIQIRQNPVKKLTGSRRICIFYTCFLRLILI